MQIDLDEGQRTIEVQAGLGKVFEWRYDVVEMKLLVETLERKHGMRIDDSLNVGRPTQDFLSDLAAGLAERGLEGCTSAVAFRLYNTIGVQFLLLYKNLKKQVAEISV